MPSSAPNLVIPLATSEMPTCNPNLMPFHINYSGLAAVSAYMRVEKAVSEALTTEDAKDGISKQANTTHTLLGLPGASAAVPSPDNMKIQENVSEDQKMQISLSTMQSIESVNCSSTTLSIATGSTLVIGSEASFTSEPTQASLPPPALEDADRRFVSTFRGRTIHGLTVDLPSGCGGLVFQSESEDTSSNPTKKENTAAKGKAKSGGMEAAGRSRGRLTRSAVSKRPEVIAVEDDDVEMADPEHHRKLVTTLDDRPVRNLVPKSQFSSFTLWHADRPVDKGSDEYFRTSTEWISLAHEIHRTDL
ncbi:ribonuclease H2, subunit C [Gymnopilus junonius]|uniref:Ribonuclease H2, subunit C n=1 Tax=Gymnopilus junonius TaxID=109634 RepID=A0A9P5TI17_GYMJU|nr:ribonuclease H2, subunit C [Gymnopilus junonius]